MWAVLLLLGLSAVNASQDVQSPACATWQECRSLALDAAAREDYETFHDLAWRAVQRGPKNDPALMTLLARAQSLSGRPGDALVMLRRLAELGFMTTDAADDEDFRRVRALQGWPELQARMADLAAGKAGTTAKPADAVEGRSRASTPPGTAKSSTSPSVPGAAAAAAITSAGSKPETRPELEGKATEALKFPAIAFRPGGLAHDAVSNRFIIGDRTEHRLAVIGEHSERLSTLTGAQSAGFGEIAALVIDRREGDLWVASVSDVNGRPSSRLHKLQLSSGRQLYTIELAADVESARFADVTLTPSSVVLVLDRDGRRLLRAVPRERELKLVARLQVDAPASVTAASDTSAFVAHARGLLHVDLASRKTRAVAVAKGVDLEGLVWIRWYRDSILAVQSTPDANHRIVRIALDSAGRIARKLTVLEEAAALSDPSAAALSGNVLYYLADPVPGGTSGTVETILRQVLVR